MRIELGRTYAGHSGPCTAIELKEPTGALLLVHGEPFEIVRTSEGAALVENKEVIRSYLEACCTPGVDVLMQLSVRDFRAVKRALFDFFSEPSGSAISSTSSSSGTAADSTKSAG